MDIVRFSILKPVTVVVGVIIILLFGIISLNRLPYQLSPTVIEPEITVNTSWRGATPYEVEREIIEEQEKALKGIPGLVEMESDSRNGFGSITLRFALGTDVDNALLRVSNKVNEVPSYPFGVDRPVINATGAATSPVIWNILKTAEDNPRPVATYLTYFENEIRQHLERVEGVADLFVGSGVESEMQIIVRPERLAAFGLTVDDIVRSMGVENVNISAGNLGVGRRDYRIRTTGEFNSPEDIESVVLRSTGQRRITLGEVATVAPGYEKADSTVIHNGRGGIAIGIKPEPGTNILEMTDRVKEVADRLNREQLASRNIKLEWVYDQRRYIRGAIDLIKQNIAIGGGLAAAVLLIFLGSVRATAVVAAAIPISVIGTFIILAALGRNLNVVSLAGIAFAVGMLVDNAIVVIENIDRHRKMGKSAFDAAYDGTHEVWGAVFASTLTTVAVFLPVVFIQEEAGQLFRDIALAVVAAVTLSLVVSVTVIPTLSHKLFAGSHGEPSRKRRGPLGRIGRSFSESVMGAVTLSTRTGLTRVTTVALLTTAALLSVVFLMPKKEYLPQGNRNLIINILVPPPGLSQAERQEIGEKLFEMAGPHLQKDHDGFPGILNMFYVGREGFMIFGAMSTHWDRARELLPLFRRFIFSLPGMFGISTQAGVFQSRIGRGRTIDVDISGDDLSRIVGAAGMMFGKSREVLPEAQVRPVPSIELTYPEVKILPDRDRLRANNMTAQDLGVAMDVLMDGRVVGDYKEEGKKTVDLVLKTGDDNILTPEDLFRAPVVTPLGRIVPVSSLASMEQTTGMAQIRHLERSRTITLQVTPPLDIPLQSAMETIEAEIISPLREQGALEGLNVRLSGAADKLSETWKAMQWNFALAAFISYLLMASLFANFLYPVIIMLTVPLAAAGGFIGLKLMNLFITPQPMDILTMLGFVILIGVVVNNAILIVHQSLNNVRDHAMAHREAVLESTRSRLRPIYMSAATSIFGMLPLVLFPGAGSELYRGLGAVILGGIAISTVFTVFVIPAILVFVIRYEKTRPAAAGEAES